MKIKQKVLCLTAAAALMTTLLAGCSAEADPVKDVMGYKSSTVLFTVDGRKVTAGDYFFWLAQAADQANNIYSSFGDGGLDWETKMQDGSTLDEYLKNDALQTAKLYSLVNAKAAEKGYNFSEEDQANYDEQIASAIEQMGGQEAYENWLKTVCLTDDGMFNINRIGTLYSHLEEGMCREGGEIEATPEKLRTYAEENQYMIAKHILLSNKDAATKVALDEAAVQEKKAKAEELAGQLSQSDDPVALFDELMKKNSEDPGLTENPDGYVFTAGQMVKEFEDAVTALEPNQISGVVESEHGYHIILRVDPGDSEALKTEWESVEVKALLQQWSDDANVEETETFQNLTTKDFYEKLTAYREKLEETDEVESGQNQNAGDTPKEDQKDSDGDQQDNKAAGDGKQDDGETGDADKDAGDAGKTAGGENANDADNSGDTPQE